VHIDVLVADPEGMHGCRCGRGGATEVSPIREEVVGLPPLKIKRFTDIIFTLIPP